MGLLNNAHKAGQNIISYSELQQKRLHSDVAAKNYNTLVIFLQ